MAARKTKQPQAPRSEPKVSHAAVRTVRSFFHPDAANETFGFARFYWLPGKGVRESIVTRFRKKRRPVEPQTDEDTAAKVEVLLPRDAHDAYGDVDFLVRHYEDKLPPDETTAYAQVTLRFPNAANAHHPFELARAWVRMFFVDTPQGGVPVVLILHDPRLACSEAPVHVHALVLPRRLGRIGWASMASELASDGGQETALTSWSSFACREFSKI